MCCPRLTRFSSKSTSGNFSFNAPKTFAVSAALSRLQCASNACVFQVEYEAVFQVEYDAQEPTNLLEGHSVEIRRVEDGAERCKVSAPKA